jgi:hypothetical protein
MSRAKTLEGLIIVNFKLEYVMCSSIALAFYDTIPDIIFEDTEMDVELSLQEDQDLFIQQQCRPWDNVPENYPSPSSAQIEKASNDYVCKPLSLTISSIALLTSLTR